MVLVLFLVLLLVVPSTPADLSEGLSQAELDALQQQAVEEGWTFTVGENPATQYSLNELCGFVPVAQLPQGVHVDPCTSTRDLPSSFDWRDLGGCTSIKNQGGCGSCWAFGTIAPLECNILIKDGVEEDLAEQWLLSCNQEGYGCWGGWWVHDYLQWKTDPCGGTGAVLEEDFPYVADEVPCNCPYPHHYYIDEWAMVDNEGTVAPVDAIKHAIVNYGPVSVAVTVTSSFQGYTGGIYNYDSSASVNHAVALVGWDDNQGTNGIWFLRNQWTSGWGEEGYMRIEYGCSNVGHSACYVQYTGSTPALSFTYPGGIPDVIPPGQSNVFQVNVVAGTGSPVPGTGQLHYSFNGGSYSVVSMTQTAPNQYEATLPSADCFDRYYWYVSAEEATVGRRYDPWNPPIGTYWSLVATDETVAFQDDFETDLGWTVDAGATTGNWERADPEEVYYSDMHYVTQPEDDHTPTGTRCYVTGPLDGSTVGTYDVDGGPTRLTSPLFDLSTAEQAKISYWRWYHISTNWDDALVVEVSNNNGGSWVEAERVESREKWTYAEWMLNDFVTPTSQVRVRFTANDTDPGSLIEALIDDFAVTAYTCNADQLPAPEVTIGDDGTNVTLTWVPVPGATSYKVYSSSSAHAPQDTWLEDTSGTLHMENPSAPYWVAPMSGTERFYYVKAFDD